MGFISVGDRVCHNSFPPVIGTVATISQLPDGFFTIGVLNDENGVIFYDRNDTWVKNGQCTVDNVPSSLRNHNVIDVDYTVVE